MYLKVNQVNLCLTAFYPVINSNWAYAELVKLVPKTPVPDIPLMCVYGVV